MGCVVSPIREGGRPFVVVFFVLLYVPVEYLFVRRSRRDRAFNDRPNSLVVLVVLLPAWGERRTKGMLLTSLVLSAGWCLERCIVSTTSSADHVLLLYFVVYQTQSKTAPFGGEHLELH